MIPLPPIAFLSISGFYTLQQAVSELSANTWSPEEQTEGRWVYANCDSKDWPHFKAYFEQLGWNITAQNIVLESGYVQNALIKPKVAIPRPHAPF
jgi:hypothetical protein